MRSFLILLVLVLAVGSAGAEENRVLRPLDVFEFETARDPRISPDGTRLVYVREFADIKTDQRFQNLWIVDADGKNHRPLVTGPHHVSSPRWSPGGDRLAYTSDVEGSSQIYVRWMDSGQTTRVTHLEQSPSALAWSPDGKRIAFKARVPEAPDPFAKMPAAPEGASWAAPPRVVTKLVNRFDQIGYLTPGSTQVFVVPAEGGTARQITGTPFREPGLVARGETPVWTPDGKHLLLSGTRNPRADLEPLECEIYEYSFASDELNPLTARKGPDFSPAVTPDGKRIAYLGFDDRLKGYHRTQLHVMDRDGSNARTISGDLDRSVSAPRWTGDGDKVFALYDNQGNTRLALFELDGTVNDLAQDVGVGGSAYSRGQYSVSRNGTFAFPHTRWNTSGEILVGTKNNAERSPTRVVVSVNDDLLSQRELATIEEIRFPSSHDELPIHGWILKPPGFVSSGEYPLILEIHGGPFANYGERFDIEKQMWAARGYLVVYVNPRGSTSYGEAFANEIHHAYPGNDFFDLDSAVDHVIGKGWVDEQNVFVTGGSGGGVLTCWMIGRSQRFTAAASAYPVINWYSFTLTTDIPALVGRYWFSGYPWEAPEEYMKRSLTSVIQNVKTPTLVITGEEDWRTPISESEQYFQALKILGVETALVRFPGEPHGIRRRPSHHISKMEHIVGWFERHRNRDEGP